MEHLTELVGGELDGEMERWTSQEEWFATVPIEEQAGLPEADQIPYVPFYSLVWFNRRDVVRMRNLTSKFSKHVKIMYRAYVYHEGVEGIEKTIRRAIGYAIIKGNIETILTIINYLNDNGLRLRILKTSMKDSFLKQYRYANGVWYRASFN